MMSARTRLLKALVSITSIIVVSAAGVTAFGARGEAAEPRRGGRFVQGLSSEPDQLNPGISTHTEMFAAAAPIYSKLVLWDRKGNPVPDLAKSWETLRDGLQYTFHLDPAARWHDGKPVTSADVKFTYEQIIAKYHPRGSVMLKVVDRIDAPDEHTVVFVLNKQFPPFMLAHRIDNGGVIVPRHVYEGTDPRTNPANRKPIGSGPFRFKEWVPGSHIVLERNPDYFKKGLPYLDTVVFRFIPDSSSRVTALLQSEIDYLGFGAIPNVELDRLKAPGVTLTREGHESIGILTIAQVNLRHKILGNRAVRQAMYRAVNQAMIGERAHFGMGRPATGPISSELAWAYTRDVPKYAYDPKKAAQMLDEAGYPRVKNGPRFKIDLLYDSSKLEFVKTAEIVRDNWNAVGIATTIVPLDTTTLLSRGGKWDYDVAMWWFSSGPDPAIGTERLYVTENIKPAFAANSMGYSNPEVDKTFRRAATTLDVAERARAYRQAQQAVVADVPAFWLHEWALPIAWRSKWANMIIDTWTQGNNRESTYLADR